MVKQENDLHVTSLTHKECYWVALISKGWPRRPEESIRSSLGLTWSAQSTKMSQTFILQSRFLMLPGVPCWFVSFFLNGKEWSTIVRCFFFCFPMHFHCKPIGLQCSKPICRRSISTHRICCQWMSDHPQSRIGWFYESKNISCNGEFVEHIWTLGSIGQFIYKISHVFSMI